MRVEPFVENFLELERQAQQRVARTGRTRIARRFQDRIELGIVERGDHGRRHHAHAHARLRQGPDRGQPLGGCGRARLQRARKIALQRGHRDEHMRQSPCRHRPDNVEIARHQIRLRHDREGVRKRRQRFQNLARNFVVALDRLVGVGIGAKGDRQRLVAGPAKLGRQQLGGVVLGKQPRLEIEPRRQPQIRVRRPRIAIDAAMLAAAIRIDRLRKRQVGRFVACDYRAAGVGCDMRAQRGQRFVGFPVPTIVDAQGRARLEPACRIRYRPAPLARQIRKPVVHGAMLDAR